MLRIRLHIWALAIWATIVASAAPVRAQTPDPPPDPRAQNVRGLLDGSLNPQVDVDSLFALDLDDPDFVDLLKAIEAAKRKIDAGEPYEPPLAATARDQLLAAYVDFFILPAEERAALIQAHKARGEETRKAAEAQAAKGARLAALTKQWEQLEAFLAGELDPAVDPATLLDVDLLAPDEACASPDRRAHLLAALDDTAKPDIPDPEPPQEPEEPAPPKGDPPKEAPPTDGESEADEGSAGAPPALSLDEAIAVAEVRLDRARAAYLALGPEGRTALAETHAAKQEPQPSVEEVPEEFVDVEEEEVREDIADAELEAQAAAREREQALEIAREARTEALFLIANERARLLGVKEQQARYAGTLPRWKQDAKALHESALEWHRRVAELSSSSGTQGELADRADALYFDLRDTLATTRQNLAEALSKLAAPGRNVPTPGRQLDDDELPAEVERADLIELRRELESRADDLRREETDTGWSVADLLRDDIVLLNHDRLTLLDIASGSLRADVTGLGANGLDQVRRELDQIALELRYHAMSLPRDTRAYLGFVRQNPVDVGLVVVQILIVLMIFRWWRRNADEILKRWQHPTKGAGQAGRLTRAGRRAVWYLRRVRKSVEWLLLLAIFPYLIGSVDAAPELVLLWLALTWILGGWTAVAVIDAIAARQQYYGLSHTGNAKLRFRSLRLVGITVTSIGLILSLTAEIVGTGAIYNWVWQTCWVLIAPIGLWLVLSWRTTIFERIRAAQRTEGILGWIAGEHSAFGGFFAAFVGGLYLLALGVARILGRYMGDLDATRKVLAYLFRREVLKRAEETAHKERGPKIEAPIYDKLGPHTTAEPLLLGPAAKLLERALEVTKAEATTITTLVGERGSGKSTFLNRLTEASADNCAVVDCPPEGFEALLGELARVFKAPSRTPESVAAAIQNAGPSTICIDDAHTMIAPAVGGLAQLDAFTRFALAVGGDVSWIVAIQRASWNFVQRARGERVFFDQVLELPRWSESEIGELIRTRTKAAGIEPGFDELVVTNIVDESEAAQGRRTETSYYRILWDHSGGNPAVALHTWRESLFTHDDDDEIVVRLFDEPSAAQIEKLPLTLLFVMRAVVQLEIGSVAEIALCTQLPEAAVADALRFSQTRGYVEFIKGRYRLAWPWYRTITTVLTRQHLLVA